MAKKKEDLFEQLKDIFSETEEDYNPTDEEMLENLKDPQLGENMDSEKTAMFVAKLYTRMSESEEFKNQVEKIVSEKIKKSR